MYYKKVLGCSAIILVSIVFLLSISYAQSRLISFQGRLTDAQGNVLDGTYNIIFSIYSSADDTNTLWTEMHEGVSVSKGLVNVLLGSIEPFGTNLLFDQEQYNPYYLGITIDTDGNINTKEPEMLPRQQIIPAGYAWNADKLDGKDGNEYTIPATDAGRPGVTEHLYEGSTRLVDKYAKKEELDWNRLKNIPSGFADGTDHVNDGVSNPSGTYNSMSVGYASSAGSASSASNASAVNGLKFSPYRDCVCHGLRSNEGEYVLFIWPANWDPSNCGTRCCNSTWRYWEVNEFFSDGKDLRNIAKGQCY